MPRRVLLSVLLCCFALPAKSANAQRYLPTIFPEQRTIEVRDPAELPKYRLRESPPPSMVSKPQDELEPILLPLDDAIRMALTNADVIRVLIGTAATSSGRTVYDTSVTNTFIDERNARFDPTVSSNNTFNRTETPVGVFDPFNPTRSLITGTRTDGFNTNSGLSKLNAYGGTLGLSLDANPSRSQPGFFPLNPQTRSATTLNYTQPLLQGGGLRPNLAPIVLARIDTERSYFQFKDSVQELVRGVIEAYWSLVAARTDLWSRRQQVLQLQTAVERIVARVDVEIDNRADLAQAQLQLANFRVNLVTSQANVIQREAALRNIIGMPPVDGSRLIPSTPPINDRFEANWEEILDLAADRRPDLIELKLIIEADLQTLQIAKNNALPRLDAVSLYRWNGLEGTMPNGDTIRSASGSFTDWTLGVNFSVPLGLRQSRAALRRQELLIARDRANLQQGLHNAVHLLATNVRALDQLYEQYLAFRDARRAARINLDAQLLRYQTQQTILLNVLQAIADWGNATSFEASALTQYNAQLATLERQTGTILETHNVVFYEERFGAIGPLGRFFADECYPESQRPTPNADKYAPGHGPSEDSFDLSPPSNLRDILDVPYEKIQLPDFDDNLPDVPPRKPPPKRLP